MRGEGGVPADRHAIRYYQKIWAVGGLMGRPERVNGLASSWLPWT